MAEDEIPEKSIKNFLEWTNTPDENGKTPADYMRESMDAFAKEADSFWNSLSYDDRLKTFFAVVSRITEGEIKRRGSYRFVLYDIFKFSPDAYTIGMECGYMDIHNLIFAGLEAKAKDKEIDRLKQACAEALQANVEISASLQKIKADLESGLRALNGE